MSTQWDPISFTVKVKITYGEILIYNYNIKIVGLLLLLPQALNYL